MDAFIKLGGECVVVNSVHFNNTLFYLLICSAFITLRLHLHYEEASSFLFCPLSPVRHRRLLKEELWLVNRQPMCISPWFCLYHSHSRSHYTRPCCKHIDAVYSKVLQLRPRSTFKLYLYIEARGAGQQGWKNTLRSFT